MQYTAKLCNHCNRWVFRFSSHAKPILASFVHLALDFFGFAPTNLVLDKESVYSFGAVILEYLKKHPGSWTSDIAVGLGIDVDVVIEALEELRREGKVE